MTQRTVLITDYAWPTLEIEREVLDNVGAKLVVARPEHDDEQLAVRASSTTAILTNWRRVPPEVLDAAPDCLVVSRFGIGVDNIPVERATELGILVTNVPAFCADEVSEHAMALVLACARCLISLSDAVRRHEWSIEPARGLRRLRGQLLGVVGFGATGRAIATKALAFGLRVVAFTPRLSAEDVPDGITISGTLEELLETCDYVTLHLPATLDTRGLIGESELRRMKPSAFLVNTSRGALVDEDALARAVQEGWIAGAALDVLSIEPPPADHRLLGLEGVLVTPHTAFYSEEALVNLRTRAAASIANVLAGRLPDVIVNSGVLGKPQLRFRAAEMPSS